MTLARVRAQLGDPEPEVRRRATQDIPGLPAPESSELLILALGDEDWRVRKEAASVAAKIEPRTATVFAVARALAEHENIGLRNAAVEALVQIGPDAVPGAIDALGRLDADGRKLAIEVLAGAPTLAGMRSIARALDDSDVNVVVAGAEALGKADLAGEEAREIATAALSELLAREDAAIRVAALASLRALDTTVPWSRLEPLASEPLLRRSAIAAAAGNVAPRALVSMAEAVCDAHASLSRDALVALGRSFEASWDEPEALEVAVKNLRASKAAHARVRELAAATDDPEARGAAILALGLMRDPDDVALIADALGDDALADRAEAALQLFGPDALTPLIEAGKTAAPSLRGATISMLPALGVGVPAPAPLAAVREAALDPSPEVVVPALKSLAIVGTVQDLAPTVRHVRSADPRVATAAQSALLAISQREPAAARALVTSLGEDDALATCIVLEALAHQRAVMDGDVARLEGALTHREAAVRRAAIEALAAVGGTVDRASPKSASGSPMSAPPTSLKPTGDPAAAWAHEAARAVTVALADEEAVVALAAIRALGRLGRSEQLAALAATTRDPMRLATVLRALRDADPERAYAAARPLLRSPEPSIAAGAIAALAGRVEALLGATDHPDHEVVKLALGEIAKTRDERAIAALGAALDHASESVRKHAAELLGQVGGEGESLLRLRLDRERSADVRRAIMEALAVRP